MFEAWELSTYALNVQQIWLCAFGNIWKDIAANFKELIVLLSSTEVFRLRLEVEKQNVSAHSSIAGNS